MDDVVWSDADAQRLKKLRLEAGMDVPELSKQSAVSAAQISQLEEGGDSLFYSPMIKYSVGKRLTLLLIQTKGLAHGSVPLIDEKVQPSSYLYSKELKAIEEMSRRNLDARPLSDALFWFKHQGQLFFQSKYVLASLIMLLSMAGISIYEKFDNNGSPVEAGSRLELLAKDLAINLAWQKAKGVFAAGPANTESSKPIESIKTEFKTTVVASNSVHTQPTQSAQSISTATALSTPIAPVLEPIFSSQGTQATLSAEQEQWCRSELEQSPLTSVSNSKPANYIYVVGLKGAQVCVKDAKNRLTWLELQAGQSLTLTGSAPWKLKTHDWSSFQLYFQGRRIAPPANDVLQLALFEATAESVQAFSATQNSAALQQSP